MMSLPPGSDATLGPLRDALAATARAQVDAAERAARADVDAALQAARQERDRLLAAAEAAGARQAAAAAALASARARRTANEQVLAQQEAIRAELRDRIRAAATALTADPRYPGILERLTARARGALGPAAVVTVQPEGGLTAVAGSRGLDLTLPTLAARRFDAMSADLEALWTA